MSDDYAAAFRDLTQRFMASDLIQEAAIKNLLRSVPDELWRAFHAHMSEELHRQEVGISAGAFVQPGQDSAPWPITAAVLDTYPVLNLKQGLLREERQHRERQGILT